MSKNTSLSSSSSSDAVSNISRVRVRNMLELMAQPELSTVNQNLASGGSVSIQEGSR